MYLQKFADGFFVRSMNEISENCRVVFVRESENWVVKVSTLKSEAKWSPKPTMVRGCRPADIAHGSCQKFT